ncbi:MAG: hypothetical protein HFE78_01850 [Clostridiales bacterium]|nr:hypothetical protein [Clostridiales bacterium]
MLTAFWTFHGMCSLFLGQAKNAFALGTFSIRFCLSILYAVALPLKKLHHFSTHTQIFLVFSAARGGVLRKRSRHGYHKQRRLQDPYDWMSYKKI